MMVLQIFTDLVRQINRQNPDSGRKRKAGGGCTLL